MSITSDLIAESRALRAEARAQLDAYRRTSERKRQLMADCRARTLETLELSQRTLARVRHLLVD